MHGKMSKNYIQTSVDNIIIINFCPATAQIYSSEELPDCKNFESCGGKCAY